MNLRGVLTCVLIISNVALYFYKVYFSVAQYLSKTYGFVFVPNKASDIASEVGEKSMFANAQNANEFVNDMKESKMCAPLIVKEDEQPTEEISVEIQSLLPEHQSILWEP
jgi:hypothetical protein